MLQKTKLMLGIQAIFIFILLIIIPLKIGSVSASVVESENFDVANITDLDEWTFQGYDLQSSHLVPVAHGFSIENGKLTAPSDNTFGDGYSRAYRHSDVSYGKWSFEWTPSSTQQSYDAFEFLLKDYASDPYNLTGRSFPEIDHYAGYVLILISYAKDGGPGIALAKFQNNSISENPTGLGSYTFDSSITGSHNVEISRDSTGKFTVYFDSVQRILQ